MSYGYAFASALVAYLIYSELGAFVPGWVAFIAAVPPTCLVMFIGLVRNELPVRGSRDAWLREGAIERRNRERA